MLPSQKMAWGNLIVWGSYLIALAVVLAVNGTVFFWQEDGLRNTFYIITGVAVAAFFIMMLLVWTAKARAGVVIDERDNEIMNRVNALAGPVAMTAVAATALALSIIYLKDKSSVMSPYFLLYITMINVVVYWLSQAIFTLIAYRMTWKG